MPRRRLLIASAAALPLLAAASGCDSHDLFAGPDPLGGPPPLAHDTVVLETAITAENRMIARYRSAMSGRAASSNAGRLLAELLAQHEQHLTQLRARLVIPQGTPASELPSSAAPIAGRGPGGAAPVTLAELRTAERQSAAALTDQLVGVQPALAQLFASIAASDATHVAALAGVSEQLCHQIKAKTFFIITAVVHRPIKPQ